MLCDPVESIKGVGEKTATLFHKEGIFTKEDLLLSFPLSYLSYPEISSIKEAKEKEWMAFSAVLQEDFLRRRGTSAEVLTARIQDKEGELTLQYFHAPYIAKLLKKGMHFVFYGQVRFYKGKGYLLQAKYFPLKEYGEKRKVLEAVYSSAKGVKNYIRRKAIASVFQEDFACEELFSQEELRELSLLQKKDSLHALHFPKDFSEREEGRKRLAFEELFYYSIYLKKEEQEYRTEKQSISYDCSEEDAFLFHLPFSPTVSQSRVMGEIRKDLLEKKRVYRFIEGDVGSGKTLIAFYLLYLTMKEGKQTAFMAPTEILAKQHYENALALFRKIEEGEKAEGREEQDRKKRIATSRMALLLGSISLKEKESIYERLKKGEILAVFGTQALIQEAVQFRNLESIVIDEQHRFGIKERLLLEKKGEFPHALFLSATPIPRSLAKLLYGSMPLSVLQEKPSDRLPIKNALVHKEEQEKVFRFMLGEIEKGRQAYVICPMIEENDGLEVENVLSYEKVLKKFFPKEIRIALLHGKMKSDEKEAVMDSFKKGEVQILLSTTVVEVGVDVANATVMLIENAERFGLAELHQLRGRVGRSALQSYCIFLDRKDDEKSRARLAIIQNSNDGFLIAKEDLRLRGPGDLFFGERQSGDLRFLLADPLQDEDLFQKAREKAEEILLEDPDLERHQAILKGLKDTL